MTAHTQLYKQFATIKAEAAPVVLNVIVFKNYEYLTWKETDKCHVIGLEFADRSIRKVLRCGFTGLFNSCNIGSNPSRIPAYFLMLLGF